MKILQGDSLEVLRGIDSESIDMCITSPPYWGLRDYGVPGQLGLESTFQEYISKLVVIFDEVKRVLKGTGTCWVNLGDTYSGNKSGYTDTNKNGKVPSDSLIRKKSQKGIIDKTLVGIPERFAIAMTDNGWIRRNTIIWHKPSCMPVSVTDRFTVDFEYLYFFSKNKDYWFEQQFEPLNIESLKRGRRGNNENKYSKAEGFSGGVHANTMSAPRDFRGYEGLKEEHANRNGRNKRCVWSINPQSYSGAHFAAYPEKLVATPIKAGCPKGGTVLDIFMGSGTTLKVARDLGRHGIGIELNPEYIELAKKRIDIEQGQLF
jgi:site-specific DNA-methyltransferase (adenine-specific)